MIEGIQNNAQVGAVFEVTADTPALLRFSIGGTTPEVLIPPHYFSYIKVLPETLSQIPPGGGG
jgi:hypothetical protein